jgi:hypothetical protein
MDRVTPTDGGHDATGDAGHDSAMPGDTGSDAPRGDALSDANHDSAPVDTGAKDSAEENDSSKPTAYDGTTGQPCATDSDCRPPGGPGVNVCSTSLFAPDTYYPTAVCILPTCAPGSGSTLHFCDGPDDSSSPGVCVPSGAGGDFCLPKCAYDTTGDAATGCLANDTCLTWAAAPESGFGYCFGGCTSDSQCPAGQLCQVDQEICVTTPTTPTKALGAACTTADTASGACYCLAGSKGTGFCTSSCTIGGPSCAAGSTCDALLYTSDGYSKQNVGMGGYCLLTCEPDGGPSCPASASCADIFVAGPDCVLP